MDDPVWITIDLAVAIHNRQLAEHGGIEGTRDITLLESDLGRPRQQFAYADPTPSIPALAAAYGFGIARNHPFADGNKRTSLVVTELFLELNGWELTAADADIVGVWMELADSRSDITEAKFAEWLRAHVEGHQPI